MKTTPKPSQIAMMAGGLVTLLFSLFKFIDNPFGDDPSAWSTQFDLFPLATWPAIFGLVVGGLTAAVVFADLKLPEPILSFNWRQINFILSFTSVVIMIGWLGGPGDKGIGFWFMFLGVIAYTAGAVMELLGIEVGGSTGSTSGPQAGSGPATPF